jgi:hypothetical protein
VCAKPLLEELLEDERLTTELNLGTNNRAQEEKVPNYAYVFHLLTVNLDKLPGTLKVADKKGV